MKQKRRRFQLKPYQLIIIVFLVQGSYLFVNCSGEEKEQATAPSEAEEFFHTIEHNQYLGDKACISCHQQAYEDWMGSHHEEAMQIANSETIKGNFNDVEYTSQGVTSRFYQKEGKFFVNTEGPDGNYQDYEILYTFGTTPLQQYIVEFPNGRYQCLRTAWDVLESKWFDLYPDFKIDPKEWLHWTGGGLNWNTMCADCHSTNLKKEYDEEKDAFTTNYAIINVSCEACHGPGKEHVEYMNSSNYQEGDDYNAEEHLHLTRMISSQEQVDQCARCHVRRVQFTEAWNHEGSFMDHYVPEILRDNVYFPDGQIMDEDYVYGSFIQSKMYANGVRCTNCHNAHSLELKLIGNALCTQCHVSTKYDDPSHHFHTVNSEGAECINCHMDGRVYMGNDYRRDHSFRVPRPDLSVVYEVPNACNQCHTDKEAEWAAEKVVDWYGPRQDSTYADILSFASTREIESVPHVIKMIKDSLQPDIARATGIWYLGQMATEEAVQTIQSALKDHSELVRYTAANELMNLPEEDKLRLVAPLLDDPVRSVRVAAMNVLADISEDKIPDGLKEAYRRANFDFQMALDIRADFPGGQLEKGQFFDRVGQTHRAESAYLKAVEMDNLFNPARINLAHIYNREGKNEEAINLFKTVIAQEPDYGPAYYSLGLLYAEENRMDLAVESLQQATEKMPENPRVFYNLGLAYQNINMPEKAEDTYQEGLKVIPGSADLLNALAILYIQQEKYQEAKPYVSQLLNMFPNHPQLQQMMQIVENGISGK